MDDLTDQAGGKESFVKKFATPTSAGRIRFRDDDISHRVTSYLVHQGLEGVEGLEIEVRDGVVTLAGTVVDDQQRHLALSSCQRVAGVLQLIDELQIESVS
ncbi:MAG: BON domain-containing protein [Pirellulaceae bacterium]